MLPNIQNCTEIRYFQYYSLLLAQRWKNLLQTFSCRLQSCTIYFNQNTMKCQMHIDTSEFWEFIEDVKGCCLKIMANSAIKFTKLRDIKSEQNIFKIMQIPCCIPKISIFFDHEKVSGKFSGNSIFVSNFYNSIFPNRQLNFAGETHYPTPCHFPWCSKNLDT